MSRKKGGAVSGGIFALGEPDDIGAAIIYIGIPAGIYYSICR